MGHNGAAIGRGAGQFGTGKRVGSVATATTKFKPSSWARSAFTEIVGAGLSDSPSQQMFLYSEEATRDQNSFMGYRGHHVSAVVSHIQHYGKLDYTTRSRTQ